MGEDVTILSLDDRDRWVAAHQDGGLPSQSWHYAWGLSANGVAPKLAVVRAGGSRMLLPFEERNWRGNTDIATILGLSGASITGRSGAPLVLWHEFAAAQGWVAGYLQLAATGDLDVEHSPVAGRMVANNAVFLLDLRHEVALASLSDNIRQKIRQAEKSGARLVDDRLLVTQAFKRWYPETMRRVGAAPRFHFPAETLDRWAADAGCLMLGARLEDEVEAVHVFRVAGGHAEYHMVGCSERGRELAAWLIWHAIVRLRELGVTVLNLTGGMRPGDGVYRFKQRFGGTLTPRRAVLQVYDPARYQDLCRIGGVTPDQPWFPAYRAPGAQS